MRWPVLQSGGFLLVVAICLGFAFYPRAENVAQGPVAAVTPNEVGPEATTRPVSTPEVGPAPAARLVSKPEAAAPDAKPASPPREAKPEPREEPKPKGAEKRREIKAVIKSVDAGTRTVVLTVKEKGKVSEATYVVAENARVRQRERNASLGDFKPAMPVKIVLGEGNTVIELKLGEDGR